MADSEFPPPPTEPKVVSINFFGGWIRYLVFFCKIVLISFDVLIFLFSLKILIKLSIYFILIVPFIGWYFVPVDILLLINLYVPLFEQQKAMIIPFLWIYHRLFLFF